jgi:hypothetical protein
MSLFLALPALAADRAGTTEFRPATPELQAVTFKGVLRHVHGAFTSEPPIPFDYWELIVNGKTYYLDLRTRALLELAEQLTGRPVVVTGLLDSTSPTIHVLSLKADEFVKETRQVEIRGWLEKRVIERDPWRDHILRPLIAYVPIIEWNVHVNGKTYRLDLGTDPAVQAMAEVLKGHSVILTGTRQDGMIRVTGLKADHSDYERDVVTVEIQGRLDAGWCPTPPSWTIVADGKTYQLDLRSRFHHCLARQLNGKTVVVTGTLKDGVVTVTGLKAAV